MQNIHIPDDLPPMHMAILKDDMDEVKRLIIEGHVNKRTECGKTPLMTAGYFCKKPMLTTLIEGGSVCNAIDENTGNTAAHYVVMSLAGNIRQCGCMMILTQAGADVTIANNDGLTVPELANKNGNLEIGRTYLDSSLTEGD
eukprot:TRINITY_DN30952_c0_g1_i1.p2 TRINITY_DN30952_c0_g1~~TRINITY_DN30952_c0_g1_i1.p2  ORF type:complete len:162 (+),score=72.92 TRINITY_DN30952_c0_g1_i1:62-487(+)